MHPATTGTLGNVANKRKDKIDEVLLFLYFCNNKLDVI